MVAPEALFVICDFSPFQAENVPVAPEVIVTPKMPAEDSTQFWVFPAPIVRIAFTPAAALFIGPVVCVIVGSMRMPLKRSFDCVLLNVGEILMPTRLDAP